MKVLFLYKCRHCSTTFDVSILTSQFESMVGESKARSRKIFRKLEKEIEPELILAMAKGELVKALNDRETFIPLRATHACSDKDAGIADLIGCSQVK